MAKLTVGQMANAIGVSVFTLKRWYYWYEQEDVKVLDALYRNGMPELPKYETIGSTNWKYWEEDAIEQLKKFKEYIPHTRRGFMGSLNRKDK